MAAASLRAALTCERVRELLDYDPATGVFAWRVSRGRRVRAGDIAGCVNANGYLVIRLDRRLYYAHRLAWLHVTGNWPKLHIDHRDTDPANNIYTNLRDVPQAVNNQNRRAIIAGKKSGLPLGVFMDKRSGRFVAALSVGGIYHFVGNFDAPDIAYTAYVVAKRELHAGCTL